MGNHWLADHRRAPGQEVADLRRVIADEGGVTRTDLPSKVQWQFAFPDSCAKITRRQLAIFLLNIDQVI